MARPIKDGLDYFPFDVDFFENDKISLIEAEFGAKGTMVAIHLLCKIYKTGYYYRWGEDECLLLTRQLGAGFVPNTVNEIVAGLVRRSFFDEGVLNSFGILTSKTIQEIYLEAIKKRASGKHYRIDPKYSLLEFSPRKPEFSPQKPEFSPQKPHKVKESKVNNTLSISPSSGDESQAASAAERETFLEILFFRNVLQPEQEVQHFCDYYDANGWKRSKGAAIIDRAAACRQWKPKQEGVRFSPRFIGFWAEAYKSLQSPSVALTGLYAVQEADGILRLSCSEELKDTIEQNTDVVGPILTKYYRGLKYIIK